jgi:hypothetical protein
MTQTARKPTQQVLAYIGREIDCMDRGFPGPFPFGCLPGGCTPNALSVLVSTGFVWSPASPGFVIRMGTAANPIRWLEQGFSSGPDASRVDITIRADVARPMRNDAECFVQVAPDTPGALPTLGHVVVWMSYLPQPLLRDQYAPWS